MSLKGAKTQVVEDDDYSDEEVLPKKPVLGADDGLGDDDEEEDQAPTNLKSMRTVGAPSLGDSAARRTRTSPDLDLIEPEVESNKLVSGQLEMRMLLACLVDQSIRTKVFHKFDEDHFSSEPANALFRRLQVYTQTSKEWLTLENWLSDPALPDSTKQFLRVEIAKATSTGRGFTNGTITLGNGQTLNASSSADFEGTLFDTLNAFRIQRKSIDSLLEVLKKVKEDTSLDPVSYIPLWEKAATDILNLRSDSENVQDVTLNFGRASTKEDDLKREKEVSELLSTKHKAIPTGFMGFDKRAGGLVPGEVVMIGAPPGHGKSALGLSIMKNVALAGYSALGVHLELSLHQLDGRIASDIANIDSGLVRNNQLTEQDHTKIREEWAGFHQKLLDVGGRYTLYAPSSCTIEQIVYKLKESHYDCVIVDYISLMTHPEKDERLRANELSKKFKQIAKHHQIVIILLVQVKQVEGTDQLTTKYSEGLLENADTLMTFKLDPDVKSKGGIGVIDIPKARSFEAFSWSIRANLKFNRFESINPDDRKNRKAGGKTKTSVADDDYSEFNDAFDYQPQPKGLAATKKDPKAQKKEDKAKEAALASSLPWEEEAAPMPIVPDEENDF